MWSIALGGVFWKAIPTRLALTRRHVRTSHFSVLFVVELYGYLSVVAHDSSSSIVRTNWRLRGALRASPHSYTSRPPSFACIDDVHTLRSCLFRSGTASRSPGALPLTMPSSPALSDVAKVLMKKGSRQNQDRVHVRPP